MHTYSSSFYELKNKLTTIYDEREAITIAHEIIYFITGLDKTQRIINKDKKFTGEQEKDYDECCEKLLRGMPLQYVTGREWFLGREFTVNSYVLIPRPETEELVNWVATDVKAGNIQSPKNILDIGTGSGCIAISLKLSLPDVAVCGCDISIKALEVARENSFNLKSDVSWLQVDILDENQQALLPVFDIILSNPPYIPISKLHELHTNVRDFEPSIALFVPEDKNPLLFYRAIALFAKLHLNKNGAVYFEVESSYAFDCKKMLEDLGYIAELRKDMNGNHRMLKCIEKKK